MTGVVLCGGSSTRMGSDKGLLKEEEETWAEIAARKLTALHLPVTVSVNPEQYPVYEQIFFKEQLIVDDGRFDARAPLFGLLSAHLQLPGEDLFVLACDIKDMTTALMQDICKDYEAGSDEVYVYHTGERPQPLCGIYSSTGLTKVFHLYQSGELKRFSMMHVLEVLQTKYIPVKEEDLSFFKNYNHPDEL